MTTIQEFIYIIEDFAPLKLQESWDNSGVQLGYSLSRECTGVALSLDVNEYVVEQAILGGANLLITHHPMIIHGVKSFTGVTPVSRIIERAIKNDLVIYSAHTSLDSCKGGINDALCEMLGLQNCGVLCPKPLIEDAGLGRYGCLPEPLSASELASHIKSVLNIEKLRFSDCGKTISRVALCSGSGGGLIEEATKAGVDAYLCGDLKYHNFEECAAKGLSLFDFGHYESEICTLEIFEREISKKIPTFAPLKIRFNPITCI